MDKFEQVWTSLDQFRFTVAAFCTVTIMTAQEVDTLTVDNVTYCWYEVLERYSWCPDESQSTETVSIGKVFLGNANLRATSFLCSYMVFVVIIRTQS